MNLLKEKEREVPPLQIVIFLESDLVLQIVVSLVQSSYPVFAVFVPSASDVLDDVAEVEVKAVSVNEVDNGDPISVVVVWINLRQCFSPLFCAVLCHQISFSPP